LKVSKRARKEGGVPEKRAPRRKKGKKILVKKPWSQHQGRERDNTRPLTLKRRCAEDDGKSVVRIRKGTHGTKRVKQQKEGSPKRGMPLGTGINWEAVL